MKRTLGKKSFTLIELLFNLKKSDHFEKEYKQNLFASKNKSSINQQLFTAG